MFDYHELQKNISPDREDFLHKINPVCEKLIAFLPRILKYIDSSLSIGVIEILSSLKNNDFKPHNFIFSRVRTIQNDNSVHNSMEGQISLDPNTVPTTKESSRISIKIVHEFGVFDEFISITFLLAQNDLVQSATFKVAENGEIEFETF